MKRTKKYVTALEIATLDHNSQDELYSKLNGLGYYWNAVSGKWERDDTLPDPASDLFRVRLWADKEKVEEFAEVVSQLLRQSGYKLHDKSESYSCRPPKQNESRIYLTFTEE